MSYWTAQAKNGSCIVQEIIGLVIYDLSGDKETFS